MNGHTQSVLPEAKDLIESWERAAAGRDKGERGVTPSLEWRGVLYRSVVFVYILGVLVVVGWWLCGC